MFNKIFKTILADILLKRGKLVDIPKLREAELGYTVDTMQLFIGTKAGNKEIGILNESSKEVKRLEALEREILKLREENEALKLDLNDIKKSSASLKVVGRLTNADVNYVKAKRKEREHDI